MLRLPFPCSILCILAAGCGGGGGGGGSPPPADNEARLLLIGGELPAGQEQLAVTIRCDHLPTGAVLFEAVLDPGPGFTIATSRASLQAIRTQPTVDGDVVGSAFKVVYGDGRNRDAVPLATGEWFQIWLQAKSPRATGSARVTLRDLRLVDAAGGTVPVAAAPVFTDVTIR